MNRDAAPALRVDEPEHRLRRSVLATVCIALVASIALTIASRARSYTQEAAGAVVIDQPQVLVADAPDAVRAQQQLEMPPPQPLPDLDVSPLVLTYHQVSSDASGLYNITPERFAQDMASLHAAGWVTIGTSQYLDWLGGRATLPPRSMLLTFDDGASGDWIYVDPVLRRYDYRAVAFIVTGFLNGDGYHLTWAELLKLKETGRWDIESHSDLGHSYVASDVQLTDAPFLINKRWTHGGLESTRRFRHRVTGDLEHNLKLLQSRGFDPPRLFAFPYAAARFPTNDPAAAAYARHRVRQMFRASMTDNVAVASMARPDRYNVPRLGVTSDIELPDLFRRQLPAFGPQLPGS